MKLIRSTIKLTLSLIPLLGSLIVAPTVSAQCIQADIAVQYNISGSRTPTERNNDVDLQSHGNCQGNASVTTGVQGNEGGTGRVRQSRVVRQRFNSDRAAPTYVDRNDPNNNGGSTIQIISNPTIDVYNAADNL